MSQQSASLMDLSQVSSGANTSKRGVKFDGAQADTLGGKIMGIAKYGAVDGQVFPVTVVGTAIVETGGAFSAGDDLVVDAQGRAVVDPAVGGEFIFADALEDSAQAGAFVEVLLRR